MLMLQVCFVLLMLFLGRGIAYM